MQTIAELLPRAKAKEFPFEIPLGRYAMNFGAFEWSLIQGIVLLVALDHQRHANRKLSTSFGRRVDLFDELAREWIADTALITSHTELIRRMKKVAITRNGFLHGPWFDVHGTDIDAQKSKLVNLPIRLGDLLKSNSARSVTPVDIHLAMLELRNTSALFSSHLSRLREAL